MPEVPVPDGRPCTVCWQPWVEHSEQHAEQHAERRLERLRVETGKELW